MGINSKNNARYIESFDEALLSFTDEKGFPWWFCVRDTVLLELKYQLERIRTPQIRSRSINYMAMRHLLYSMKKTRAMKKAISEAEILFHVSTRYAKDDNAGQTINVYADYFAEAVSNNACIVERAPTNWAISSTRLHKNSYGIGWVDSKCFAEALLRQNVADLPCELIGLVDHFEKRIKKIYGDTVDPNEVRSSFKHAYGRYLAASLIGKWIINAIGEKTAAIFMIGSIYSENCSYVKALKERGLKVIELQHGAFDPSNVVCNPAPLVSEHPLFLNSKPDYWILYGQWWANQTSIPCEKVAIGSPFHDKCVESVQGEAKDTILIIGCAHDGEKYISLANRLRLRLGNWRVAFRPHPIELEESRRIIQRYPGVVLDEAPLYRSLSRSKLVAGCYSTVLFEAAGVAEKVVIFHEEYSTIKYDELPFRVVSNFDELVLAVEDSISKSELLGAQIWAPDWEGRFREFICDVLHVGRKEDSDGRRDK